MDLHEDAKPNDTLWRYMDIAKFLDLLLNRSLAFPRFDQFEDPYEGYAANFVELIKSSLANDNEFDEATINFAAGAFKDAVAISNYYTYISCWHLNKYESAGMWKLYCKAPESLAVKTNVESLKKSLLTINGRQVIFSKIKYDSKLEQVAIKDLGNVNVFNSLLMKRESFEHEKEYRVIIIDKEDRIDRVHECYMKREAHINRSGHTINDNYESSELDLMLARLEYERSSLIKMEINLDTLIKEIVVSPHSPKWFLDVVKNLVRQLGFSFEVTQSELYNLS